MNAWSHPIPRLTVNTCTLDHPRALPLYQRMGFRALCAGRTFCRIALTAGLRAKSGRQSRRLRMTPDGKELTLRGMALGVALTLLFTAANIYLGLKVGITFATSLPAAVISMALLGLFSGSNIRENNIVQTVCSVGRRDGLDHFRAARPGDRGLVDRLSVLDLSSAVGARAACWACCSPFRCGADW